MTVLQMFFALLSMNEILNFFEKVWKINDF